MLQDGAKESIGSDLLSEITCILRRIRDATTDSWYCAIAKIHQDDTLTPCPHQGCWTRLVCPTAIFRQITRNDSNKDVPFVASCVFVDRVCFSAAF
jgi:hypothetical protein